MSDKGDFLAGLIVGGLVGLVAGVLFAPQSGEEVRSAVRDRATDTIDRVRDVSDHVRDGVDRLRDGVDRLREGVAEMAGSVRERFTGADEQTAGEAPATPTT